MGHQTNTQPLVDELLDRYLSWREACAALEQAYRRWATAVDADRPLAFATYCAQLEIEEHAAGCYQLSAAAATAALERTSPSGLDRSAAIARR